MLKERRITCPKCRKATYCESVDQVAKNNLIANLVASITASKASCPECKQLCELLVCEHCSQIFCDSCLEVGSVNQYIFKKTFNTIR